MVMQRIADLLPNNVGSFLITSAVNLPIGVAGDVLINLLTPPLPVIAGLFLVKEAVIWNPRVNGVPGSVAAGLLGIFTGPGATGNTIAANQALTPTTTVGAASAQDLAITAGTTFTYTAGGLYVNVGTPVAGATININLYGTVLLP